MTSSKNTKRALLASVLSVVLCAAMLVGSTFAWFTDSVTSAGNRIVAGNLEVDLVMDKLDGNGYVSIADGKGDIFDTANVAQNSNKTLWEPGKTQIVYLGVQNKGNLALKYNILLNIQDNGLAGALEYAVLDGKTAADLANVKSWTELTGMAGVQTGDIKAGTMTVAQNGRLDEIINEVEDETDYFALAVHMKEGAGNEFQNKDITIDVTVVATQAAAESDSFGNQYDIGADAYITDGTTGLVTVDGIENTYFVINADSLKAVAEQTNSGNSFAGKTIVLMNDIDLGGDTWTPIGSSEANAFAGTLDGGYHSIRNLKTPDGVSDYAYGLIGYGTGNVTVKNLTVDVDYNITSGESDSVGGIMGLYINDGDEGDYNVLFDNITVNGTISAPKYVGGILGGSCDEFYTGDPKNITITMNNCTNNADITGTGSSARAGGIAGKAVAYFAGDTNGNSNITGIECQIIFENCTNNGDVTADSSSYQAGGIAGFLNIGNHVFTNCENNGDIRGNSGGGELFGRLQNVTKYAPKPTSNTTTPEWGYFEGLKPETLTLFDVYTGNVYKVLLNFYYSTTHPTHYNQSMFWVGTTLAEDEWRLTIDGKHYSCEPQIAIDGAEDCTEITEHKNNPSGDELTGMWNNNSYDFEGQTVGSDGTSEVYTYRIKP